MQFLRWLFQTDEGQFVEVTALDRETSFSVAPQGAKLLDSRPLYEGSWNLEGKSPGDFTFGPREPRLSAGIQPVSYRRMSVAERQPKWRP